MFNELIFRVLTYASTEACQAPYITIIINCFNLQNGKIAWQLAAKI